MAKGLKAFLVFCIVLVCVAAAVVTAFFAATFAGVNADVKAQRRRLERLRAAYESGDYICADEQKFCDFNLESALQQNIKLIDLQFLATHNSYKKEKTDLEKFYAKFSEGLKSGNYSYEPLTDQLNAGIRSLEYDLFYREHKDGVSFHSFHIGYADMSSNAFDFAACLEELDLWSRHNPNHLPVTVILELKERGGAYPYKTVAKKQLGALDALLKEKISDLYAPSKALKGYADLNDMRAVEDSPSLKETMGKIIFILHRGSLTEDYVNMDEGFKTQAMFPSAYSWRDKAVGKQSFVIINNHGVDEGSIDENGGRKNKYLFRVMIDDETNPNPSLNDVLRVVASDATICSTNRPPRLNPLNGYECVAFSSDGKTVKLVQDVNCKCAD